MKLKVPKKGSTSIANPTSDSLLALAEFPCRDTPTASESCHNTSRIAVALLANGEVVKPFLAFVALIRIEIIPALANPFVVARHSDSSMRMTVARKTFGILVIPGAALAASLPGEVAQTGTFSRRVTNRCGCSDFTTIARFAVRVTVITRKTLIATFPAVTRFTKAFSVGFIANARDRAVTVAVAI